MTDNFLRDELGDRLRKADLVLDFLVQFYVDDIRTPIENTSVAWDTPQLHVAQLRDDPRAHALSEAVNKLSFSPWHATDDHRPLGNVMRARRVVYGKFRSSGSESRTGCPSRCRTVSAERRTLRRIAAGTAKAGLEIRARARFRGAADPTLDTGSGRGKAPSDVHLRFSASVIISVSIKT